MPAFNESISTLDGHPHGHILYSWNSGYWWMRKEIRRRLGQTGDDPVDRAIVRLGVTREPALRLGRSPTSGVTAMAAADFWDRLFAAFARFIL